MLAVWNGKIVFTGFQSEGGYAGTIVFKSAVSDENGELKPEMILVCNAIMNNLKHANEYIRGCTLRFLSKITEEEILEPLVIIYVLIVTYRFLILKRI